MSHFDHHRLREETVSHQIDNHKMRNLDISRNVLIKSSVQYYPARRQLQLVRNKNLAALDENTQY